MLTMIPSVHVVPTVVHSMHVVPAYVIGTVSIEVSTSFKRAGPPVVHIVVRSSLQDLHSIIADHSSNHSSQKKQAVRPHDEVDFSVNSVWFVVGGSSQARG